jgi:UDP-glucose 4-epimerase
VSAVLSASGTAGTFNVATGIETDVMSVWASLQRASGMAVEPELAPLRAGELERSCLDPARARRELDWHAQISLDAGLGETYAALIDEFQRLG